MISKNLIISISFLLGITFNMYVTGQSETEDTRAKLQKQIQSDKEDLQQAELAKKSNAQIELLKNIGAGFQRLNKFDSAIYYYEQGLNFAIESGSKELSSSLLYNLGLVYLNKGL